MEGFSLKANPFALLRVSPRAKIAEIEDAFEETVIERPHDEQALLKTKQLLLTPNARLFAELSWLSDIAPRRANQLLAMLDCADVDALLKALPDLPPLSLANIAAEACARLGEVRFIPALIEAHGQIAHEATFEWLNSTRATAGFARVEASQIKEALRALRASHARSAVAAIVVQTDPPAALTAVLEARNDAHDLMLKEIFREYDHWSSPHLGEIERDIDAALSDLMAGHDRAVDRVNERLAAWDELSQPAQLYSQLSGLDEERSLRIYRRVRSHCIDLANDHQRFADAHAVATVMRHLFKELPTAAAELEGDIDTLARLSDEKQLEEAISPLLAALASAREQVRGVITGLRASGFKDGAHPQITALRLGLVGTMDALARSEYADAPIRMVRSFALDLNNEHDDPIAALNLLKGLIELYQPRDPVLLDQIKEDIRISENNANHRLLTRALETKNHGEAIRIVDLMVAANPAGEEGAQLRLLQERLKQQRTRRYLKWGAWAAAAAFVAYLISQDGGGSSSYSPPNSVPEATTAETSFASPTAELASPPADDVALPAPAEDVANAVLATDVSPPPVGSGLELEASQVRYCTFEKARLTALQGMVSDTNSAAIDGFNARVADYNARCGSFRYRPSDLDAAQAVVTLPPTLDQVGPGFLAGQA
ncbi:hypothetical protein, partial [uncultured Caulobacter sp.]|uniref:hypothetical protein n=1 Tax=uncultured Caulobacter sp. TaxID=158749 RepID=UPI002614EFBE